MKLTKLLVLGVLLLVGKNAWAAVDANVWQKPAFPAFPEVTEFATYKTTATLPSEVDGEELYFYNVGTHMFWTSGNNWATRASLTSADGQSNGNPTSEGVKGSAIYFVPTSAATALGEDVVEIKNYMHRDSKFLSAFGGNAFDDIWTDNDGRDDRFWKIIDQGNGTYRLQNVLKQKELFVGWTPDYADTRLYFLAANAEGACIDWKLVSPAAYEAWYASLPENAFDQIVEWRAAASLYNTAMDLKKVLDQAEAIGAKVDDQLTVYNNTGSTAAQLTEAISKVKEAIQAREKEMEEEALGNATAADPKSATSFITNPDYVSSLTEGWTAASGTDNFGAYNGKENAELYDKNKINVYQKIQGLPNGVYAVGVNAFYRAGTSTDAWTNFQANNEASRYAKLFAFNGSDSLFTAICSPYKDAPTAKTGVGDEQNGGSPYYIPNNMVAAEHYMHNLGLYKNTVFSNVEDGTLTIGLFKNQKVGSDWLIVDDWSLTYYGAGADAYQLWSDTELAKNAYTPAEGALYTESYLAALTAATTSKAAASKAEVEANIAAAKAARADLNENMALWSDWKKLVEEASKMAYADEYQDFDEILDVMEYADPAEDGALYKAIEAAHNLDNAALAAEIEKLNNIMEAVKEAVKNAIQPGQDVTNKLLVNPTFNMLDGDTEKPQYGWTGWGNTTNGMPTTGGLHLADVKNREDYNLTAEAWSAKEFDLYQEVENAPVGVYEIEVQGFFRYGRDDAGKQAYQAQEVDYVKKGGAPVYVYLNDVKTPFMNIYDEPSQGQEFYATMAQVDETTGEYKKGENGVYQWRGIPYSVQNYPANAEVPDEYYPNGMTSAALAFSAGLYKQTAKSLIAKKGDKMRIGVKGSTQLPENGDCWVIWDNFKLTYLGFEVASVKPLLEDAIEAANKNLEKHFGTDLRATLLEKLDAAQALLNSEDGRAMFNATSELVAVDVDGSVALFEKLEAAVIDMQNFAGAQSEVADGSVVNAAYALGEEISLKLEGFNMSDTEANEYLDKIAEMMDKLKIPAGMENASDDNEVDVTAFITNPRYSENNNDGWAGDGPSVSYHEAEMFNKNFDYYQDLEGLLPGTYMVSLQGFYRAGGHGPANDYNTWLENPEANNNAILYVNAGGNTNQTALKRLCTEMIQLAAGEEISDGWAAAKTDTLSWEPDTVVQHYIVPNNMEQAEQAFLGEDPDYNYSGNEVIFKVGDDGKARIGVKKTALLENDWTLWSNWKLTYYGKNSSKETGILSATSEGRVVKTEYFSLSGSRLKNARGLVIVKQTMSDGRVRVIKKVK